MSENEISGIIIGKAIEIHKKFGPGLLESAYEACLIHELTGYGFAVEQQKPMPLVYKEITLEQGYRMDLLIENKVVVEIKHVEAFMEVHFAQILTYLRLGNYQLGLLINFNVPLLKNGIRRVIN